MVHDFRHLCSVYSALVTRFPLCLLQLSHKNTYATIEAFIGPLHSPGSIP